MNLYGFAGGDPVNFSDPFGLCPPRTMAEVLICTGQLLAPAQRPLEIAGTVVTQGLVAGLGATMRAGAAITTLGLGRGGSLAIVGSGFSASEQAAARYMAARGNEVVLRSASGSGRMSDLLVNGKAYDVYTPRSGNPLNIISNIVEKGDQAQGIVLDLSQTSVTRSQLIRAAGGDLVRAVQQSGASRITNIVIMP